MNIIMRQILISNYCTGCAVSGVRFCIFFLNRTKSFKPKMQNGLAAQQLSTLKNKVLGSNPSSRPLCVVCMFHVTFTAQKHRLEAIYCLQACVYMLVCVLCTGDLSRGSIPASHLVTTGISDELAMKRKKKNICLKSVTNTLNNNKDVMM